MRHIESDDVKLGVLIKISRDISKEWNLFDSEMKKQVDHMIKAHLPKAKRIVEPFRLGIDYSKPQKRQPLSQLEKQQLKSQCLKAYRAYEKKANQPPAVILAF